MCLFLALIQSSYYSLTCCLASSRGARSAGALSIACDRGDVACVEALLREVPRGMVSRVSRTFLRNLRIVALT